MSGWVDVDGFAESNPASAKHAASASTAAASASSAAAAQLQPCRAEAAGQPSPAVLEEAGCSPTLLSSPRRSSRMSARTTSC